MIRTPRSSLVPASNYFAFAVIASQNCQDRQTPFRIASTEIEMTSRPRRWLLSGHLGAGLLALAVLWLPYDAVAMSFSGPCRITTHVGLLFCVEVSTHYRPLRLGTRDLFQSRPIEPPPLKPGE